MTVDGFSNAKVKLLAHQVKKLLSCGILGQTRQQTLQIFCNLGSRTNLEFENTPPPSLKKL